VCKSHVLRRFRADEDGPPLLECWAIGDNLNDLGLLRLADRAFAIEPKAVDLRSEPGITVIRSFDELLPLVPAPLAPAGPAPAVPPAGATGGGASASSTAA